MDVRFRHVRDAKIFILRCGDVLLHVAIGIYDERLSRPLAADEVARLGEFGIVEALEEHSRSPERRATTRSSMRALDSGLRRNDAGFSRHRDDETRALCHGYPRPDL